MLCIRVLWGLLAAALLYNPVFASPQNNGGDAITVTQYITSKPGTNKSSAPKPSPKVVYITSTSVNKHVVTIYPTPSSAETAFFENPILLPSLKPSRLFKTPLFFDRKAETSTEYVTETTDVTEVETTKVTEKNTVTNVVDATETVVVTVTTDG